MKGCPACIEAIKAAQYTAHLKNSPFFEHISILYNPTYCRTSLQILTRMSKELLGKVLILSSCGFSSNLSFIHCQSTCQADCRSYSQRQGFQYRYSLFSIHLRSLQASPVTMSTPTSTFDNGPPIVHETLLVNDNKSKMTLLQVRCAYTMASKHTKSVQTSLKNVYW